MNKLNFNIYNVIILTGIIHGFLFSLIVFFNKKLKSKTNYYLALTVLTLVLSNLQYWLIDTNIVLKSNYDSYGFIYLPFEFLMLPFFFLFVKSFLNIKTNTFKKVLLLLPFTTALLYLIFTSTNSIFNPIIEFSSIIFSITIITMLFKIISDYEKKKTQYSSKNISIETSWLKRILVIGLTLCILYYFATNTFIHFFNKGSNVYYPLWIGISVLTYWIGYSSILQKQLVKERANKRKQKLLPNKIIIDSKNKSITWFKIDSLIAKNKLYLNPNLSLGFLAKELNLSEGYISQLINKSIEYNFNDYVNKYRVEEVKKMLRNEEYNRYTILAIGLEAGFNSKSSFNSVFKKLTGVTPSEYKKLTGI